MTYTISNLHRDTFHNGFGYSDGFIAADVELEDGTHISLSRRDDEGPGALWLADSLLPPNGLGFSHGAGARDTLKRPATDQLAADLTSAAREAGLL